MNSKMDRPEQKLTTDTAGNKYPPVSPKGAQSTNKTNPTAALETHAVAANSPAKTGTGSHRAKSSANSRSGGEDSVARARGSDHEGPEDSPCRFGAACVKRACALVHPDERELCALGKACTSVDCVLTCLHPPVCNFQPCANRECSRTHVAFGTAEVQKKVLARFSVLPPFSPSPVYCAQSVGTVYQSIVCVCSCE